MVRPWNDLVTHMATGSSALVQTHFRRQCVPCLYTNDVILSTVHDRVRCPSNFRVVGWSARGTIDHKSNNRRKCVRHLASNAIVFSTETRFILALGDTDRIPPLKTKTSPLGLS